jgi:FMN phosphatase YigB (HAD superfamily)
MLSRLVEDTGIPREVLEQDFKKVFERHGTSEYAFAIEELDALRRKYPRANLATKFKDAIREYNTARIQSLKLFPEVMNTLLALKKKGCLLVGYTDSMGFYTNYRIRLLELDGILDFVYSPKDHDLPKGMTREQIRRYPRERYLMRHTIHRNTPLGVLKPNKDVLIDITKELNVRPENSLYVGDNLMKDISMAKTAGIIDVWAKYGVAQQRPEYDLLRRVTHWSAAAVEKEKRTNESNTPPSYTLRNDFGQILDLFKFEKYVDPIPKADPERRKAIIEVWKKTIDVQQHFNDLELRIRNYALTTFVAVVGAAGLVLNQHIEIVLAGYVFPLSAILLIGGLLAWFAFYFMDRFWYHMLLYGAVEQGTYIEARARVILPELALTHTIGRASPLRFLGFEIHSTRKIDFFYGLVAASLVILILVLILSPITSRSLISANQTIT